ncbi:hypothetical protein TNCV_4532621 [Trichonephila clavipes]|nr:hypothetical protein TNCV_4532621 [Trichonephila clavipes]
MVAMPYLRGFRGVVFQQGNSRLHVAHPDDVLQHRGSSIAASVGVYSRLIENIWSWVAKRLDHHRFPAAMIKHDIDLKQHGIFASVPRSPRRVTALEPFWFPDVVDLCNKSGPYIPSPNFVQI